MRRVGAANHGRHGKHGRGAEAGTEPQMTQMYADGMGRGTTEDTEGTEGVRRQGPSRR